MPGDTVNSSGRLDGWRDGRNTWVTADSVNARLRDGFAMSADVLPIDVGVKDAREG